MSDRTPTPESSRATRPARVPRGRAADARPLTGLQLESWRLLWQQLLRDADALAECRVWEERRRRAAPEMVALLRRFLDRDLGIAEFRAAVDRGTRAEWDAFGMRGSSGAMFLNRLARLAVDDARVEPLLRDVLTLPRDADGARSRLSTFIEALSRDAADDRGASPLQPARAAFFASVWWDVQDSERWPVFQPTARRALREEQDVFVPRGVPADDYVAFREAFLAVAAGLRTSAWEIEYLCWWRQQRGAADEAPDLFYEPGAARTRPAAVREPRRAPLAGAPRPETAASPGSTSEARPARAALHHTHVQWVLARLGKKLGCRVWVAANDHAKSWQGRPLGELSVRRLPSLGLSAASQGVVSLIDVVWLRGANEVAAAFEIEHTTSVYSGLLRLADLAALSPNLRFPLYIVAPRARLEKVRRELARPSLRALGLHERCAFLSAESLLDAADSIMRWATDPSAIDRLATRPEDLRALPRAD